MTLQHLVIVRVRYGDVAFLTLVPPATDPHIARDLLAHAVEDPYMGVEGVPRQMRAR
jgi:hypothetical protein